MNNTDHTFLYRVVVTGDRCGTSRTYEVRSAWIEPVVAGAIAKTLAPKTHDTQLATFAVQRRDGDVWQPVRFELSETIDYPLVAPAASAAPARPRC